jgi:hypothetical protein
MNPSPSTSMSGRFESMMPDQTGERAIAAIFGSIEKGGRSRA